MMNSSTTLRNFLLILFKRKSVLLVIFSSFILLALTASYLISPVYRADAKILVERELDAEKALLFRVNLTPAFRDYNWINSEMEIIKSYSIAARVVEELPRKVEEREPGQPEARVFERKVKLLMKRLQVSNPRNTNVIKIRYQGTDPEFITRVANQYVEAYRKYRSELASESGAYKFFERQIQLADAKLRELERRQADFKQRNEVLSPEAQEQILRNKLTEFENRLTDVRTRRIGKEATLSVIQKQLQAGRELSIPRTETSDSPSRERYIAELKGKLLELEIEREALLQKFTPRYVEVKNLEKQIAATREKMKKEISQIIEMEEASIRALQAEEAALQRSIASIMTEIKQFAEKEYEFNQISRGIADNREVYSMLLKQREEAGISLAKLEKGIKIKVITRAIVPTDPVFPNKKLNLISGLLLGILAGIAGAMIAEYLDHRIHTVAELEKYTGLQPLGFLREIKGL